MVFVSFSLLRLYPKDLTVSDTISMAVLMPTRT